MLERTFAGELPSGAPGVNWPRKLRRLAFMSPAEVVYRLLEWGRITRERRRQGRPAAPEAHARHAPMPALPSAASTRRFLFVPTATHRRAVAGWVAEHRPAHGRAARAEGDKVLAHEIELLGFGHVHLGDAIDWHRDPVDGRRWPLRFWADYDLVHEDGPDAKVVHELNRHGHLPRLARAYYWTGDERYAREAVEELRGWIAQNPEGLGVNWCSSLEIALRAIAWMTTLALLTPSAALDACAQREILASLRAQLRHVRRYPSVYSSPNTHWIAEAAALFMGGCFLAGLPEARGFREAGRRWLEKAARSQVRKDGVYGELSTYYHAYALDLFLLCVVLGERAGFFFSRALHERIGRMADFLAAVCSADGRLPQIGDDDGGAAFTLAGTSYHDIRPLLSSAAILTRRDDLYQPGAFSHALWLFGPGEIRRREERAIAAVGSRGGPARAGLQCFPNAGYFVQTLAAGPRRARLIFDAGDMGLASGGHGHADALSVQVTVGETPVLVDPGTFVYNRAPEWREFFRSTRAHNTVVVDDRSQSRPGDTFEWERMARVQAGPVFESGGLLYCEGTHDGYRHLEGRPAHRRRILGVAGSYWLIVDEIVGRGRHRLSWTYHLPAGCPTDLAHHDGVWRLDLQPAPACKVTVAFAGSAPGVGARIVEGQRAPIQGWVSHRYGEKAAAPVLELAAEESLPILGLTLVWPWEGPAPTLRVERGAGHLIARVVGRDETDLVILNRSGKTLSLPEASFHGELLWLRPPGGSASKSQWLTAGLKQLCVDEAWVEGRDYRKRVLTGRGCDVLG